MQNLKVEQTSNRLFAAAKDLFSLKDIYTNLKEIIKGRTGAVKYKTGIEELDYILWGMHKKELLVYGARTSQGKSDWVVNTTKALVDCGQTVLYFSLEMSKEQLLQRFLSNICGIDNHLLRTGKAMHLIEEREDVFKTWIENVNLYIDDTNGHHFNKIIDICKLTKPDFVVIDYVQMISTKGFKQKLDAMEDFIKEIHTLGKKTNFGTILVSQINRGGTDRPYLEHLKGAGMLEEHPDTVLLAQWDWEKNEYTIWVEKQLHGATGKVKVKYEPQYSRMSDSDIPTTPEIRKDLQ